MSDVFVCLCSRAIINHFNPKIESYAAVNHISQLSEEQVNTTLIALSKGTNRSKDANSAGPEPVCHTHTHTQGDGALRAEAVFTPSKPSDTTFFKFLSDQDVRGRVRLGDKPCSELLVSSTY